MNDSKLSETFPRGVELVGSAVIENDQGQILLVRSPKWHDKWVLPGGHIESGETVLWAINREGMEETGLELRSISVFNWGELINSKDFHRPAHFVFFDVYSKVVGGELKLDETELSEFQWMIPEQAFKLDLAESYKETIEAFTSYMTRN